MVDKYLGKQFYNALKKEGRTFSLYLDKVENQYIVDFYDDFEPPIFLGDADIKKLYASTKNGTIEELVEKMVEVVTA